MNVKRSVFILLSIISLVCMLIARAQEAGDIPSPHVIMLFIEPYLRDLDTVFEGDLQVNLDNLAHKQLKTMLTPYLTVFASYEGRSAKSNDLGQIIFPRRHQSNDLTLIITKKIAPVLLPQNTVQDFVITDPTQARAYTFTQKHNDEEDVWFWDVQEKTLKQNEKISPAALILFANPDNIIVPLKKTITISSPHLLLPTIYATKNFNIVSNALAYLKVNKYFSPVKRATKFSADRIGTIVW